MNKQTYDWNGKAGIPVSGEEISDHEVALRVRMLMRNDPAHEFVCNLARDRIMALSKEKANLEAEVARLRAALQCYADRERWSSGITDEHMKGSLICYRTNASFPHGWHFAEFTLSEVKPCISD